MTTLTEIAIQMRAAVKGYVARALVPVVDDLRSLRVRLDSLPVPVDGKDADPEEIRRLVVAEGVVLHTALEAHLHDAIAAIPKPHDGKDADPEFVTQLVKDHVFEAVSALPAPQGPPGRDGTDADPEQITRLVAAEGVVLHTALEAHLDAALAAIPKAQDGKDADPAVMAQLISADVATAVSAIPAPLPGEKGDRGNDGTDGIDGLLGEHGKDAADIVVLAEIDEAKVYPRGTFACYKGGMIHATRKTSPITEGLEAAGWKVCMNGIAEESEEVGAKGAIKRTTVYTSGAAVVTEIKNGAVSYRGGLKDGKVIDLDAIFEARIADWKADFDRRAQMAIDHMPKPHDGRDGVNGEPGGSIEDFAIEVKDRTLAVGMKIGGINEARTVKLDMPIYRDVYQSGRKYEKGDMVTFSGSMFIAMEDTTDKPETSKAWKLAVKRGQNGKDGKDAPVPEAIES